MGSFIYLAPTFGLILFSIKGNKYSQALMTSSFHSPRGKRLFTSSQHQAIPSDSALERNTCSNYWDRLGKPKYVLAPMVSQSDLAFRLLCRKYGANLCFTQMIHAQNFITSKVFQDTQLDVYKENVEGIVMNESGWNALKDTDWEGKMNSLTAGNGSTWKNIYHDDTLSRDRRWMPYREDWKDWAESSVRKSHSPLIVQIAGHDPSVMSSAAKLILQRTATEAQNSDSHEYRGAVGGIDVNCGCPQAIARSGRYGAFLMEDNPTTVYSILKRLRRDLPPQVGVSAKIRIPEGASQSYQGKRTLQDRLMRMIDSGVELITVHGRTIRENKTKTRQCDWDAISLAVQTAREFSGMSDFPVIANGGIEFSSDIQKCLDHTHASAVMSSEGILENPGIFMQGALDDTDLTTKEILLRQLKYCNDYLDLCMLYPPLSFSLGKASGSFNCVRGHIFKILYRYLEDHPDLRDLLGHPRRTASITDARRIVMELERRYHVKTEVEFNNLSSSDVPNSSWYRRHRNSVSLVHIRDSHASNAVVNNLNVDEKKQLILSRIDSLKRQKEKRGAIY